MYAHCTPDSRKTLWQIGDFAAQNPLDFHGTARFGHDALALKYARDGLYARNSKSRESPAIGSIARIL
jgi:hypothetical protein